MKTNASISSLENENIAIQNILIEIHAAAVNVEKKFERKANHGTDFIPED